MTRPRRILYLEPCACPSRSHWLGIYEERLRVSLRDHAHPATIGSAAGEYMREALDLSDALDAIGGGL